MKKNTGTTKKTPQPNPLHSGQWLSESTASRLSTESSSASSGSPSSGPEIRIEYADPKSKPPGKKVDVTGLQTEIEVGNVVALTCRIIPANLAPAGDAYTWEIPDKVLKNYNEKAASNPVEVLPANVLKKKSLSFHRLNAGEKSVNVSVLVNGVNLKATTTFVVSRPTAKITAQVVAQPAPPQNGLPGKPNEWVLDAGDVVFALIEPDPILHGKFVWVQMINNIVNSRKIGDDPVVNTPPPGQRIGLDKEFPYSGDPAGTEDNPQTKFKINLESWAQREMNCTMYLMYRSDALSRYVPLRAIDWKTISAAFAGPNGIFRNPPNYVQDPGAKMEVKPPEDRDVIDPPDWPRIIKGG